MWKFAWTFIYWKQESQKAIKNVLSSKLEIYTNKIERPSSTKKKKNNTGIIIENLWTDFISYVNK